MKTLRRVLLAVVVVFACFVCVRAVISPVIFRFKDPSALDPADGLYVVFSPLRSRVPEQEADAFLKSLQSGECGRGFLSVEDRFCEKESRYRLVTWEMVDRLDNTDGSASLHFKVSRTGYSKGAWGNAWVTVAPKGQSWKVTNYDTYY